MSGLLPENDRVPEYVFVYGTLRDGEFEDALLTNARVDRTGAFPTITPGNAEDHVLGELRPVEDRDDLERLDFYEGISSRLYARLSLTETIDAYIGEPERLRAEEAEHTLADIEALREHFAEEAVIIRGDAIAEAEVVE